MSKKFLVVSYSIFSLFNQIDNLFILILTLYTIFAVDIFKRNFEGVTLKKILP